MEFVDIYFIYFYCLFIKLKISMNSLFKRNLLVLIVIIISFMVGCKKENKEPVCSMDSFNTYLDKEDIQLVSIYPQDEDGKIVKVELYLDDKLLVSITTPPYTYSLDPSLYEVGKHVLEAIAYDDNGATASDSFEFYINGPLTVKTLPVTDITYQSAKSGLKIEIDGSTIYSENGLIWYTKEQNSQFVYEGSTHSGEPDITNLDCGTDYFVRAYVVKNSQYIFGEMLSFKTLIDKPVVVTNPVTEITPTKMICSASILGEINKIGVKSIGFVWSINNNPTLTNYTGKHIVPMINFSEDLRNYGARITNATSGVKNYVRAFATNSADTVYGNPVEVDIPPASGTFIDTRDNREYSWVYIGTQYWMAENLAYLPAVDDVSKGSEFVATPNPFYYVYNYTPDESLDEVTQVNNAKATANYKTYGVLYNWQAAMNGAVQSELNPSGVQGVCPDGWHLPSQAEWNILSSFAGYQGGGNLKSTGTDLWQEPNSGATNITGFNGYPGGNRSRNHFDRINLGGYWWTTSGSMNDTYFKSLSNNSLFLASGNFGKEYGFSVRCIKN